MSVRRCVITVGDLGEFGVIARISGRLPQGETVLLGPGDDAAMVSAPDGRVVVSTDVLIEGRHFRRAWSSGYDVGRRAAAQNLADVAAMGAVPTAVVVGLGIPADLPVTWVDALADGLRDECALVGASVAGGDITRCDPVVIAVTVLGDLEGRAPVERSGARPGHLVAVAGRLGRSAAGLALLQSGHVPPAPSHPPTGYEGEPEDRAPSPGDAAYGRDPEPEESPREAASPEDVAYGGRSSREAASPEGGASGGRFSPEAASPGGGSYGGGVEGGRRGAADLLDEAVRGHRRPEPPYACGPEAARLGASAMIDVSDGLLQDLGHLARAGGVRIDLDPEAFTVPDEVNAAAAALGADPLDWVLTGGEDHALAAVFPPEVRLPASWQVVGRVSEGEGVHVRGRAPGPGGWDHFR